MLSKHNVELVSYLDLFQTDFDIIVLSEIGKEGFRYLQSTFPDYSYTYDIPEKNKYGGVAIMVKKSLGDIIERNDLKVSKDCDCDEFKFENVWIQLTKAETTIIIGGIYRHPKGNITHFNGSLTHSLENIKETETCILVGDININLINLDNQKTYDYLTSLLSQNFIPGITLPTRIKDDSMTLIDHIFVRLPHKRSDRKLLSGNLFSDITDHLAIFVCIEVSAKNNVNKRAKTRIYNDNNYKSFFKKLAEVDWETELEILQTVDAKYDYFLSTFNHCFATSFPEVQVSRKRAKDKKWITTGLKESIKHKNRLYMKYLKKPTDENKLAYARYKNKVTDCLRIAEMNYYEKIFSDRANSANIMWKHLGSILNPHKHKKTFKIPYLIKEGITISNDHEIANTMNRHFCNIGPELASRLPSKIDGFKKFLSNKIDETIFLSPTSEQEISKEISKLKPNKSSGPDGISPRLIRDCAPCIIKPLTIIFNNSLETAKYPSALKMAKVLALYKKNEMYLPDNYRPISLLSCFDKLFEKIIYHRLISFIEKHKILYINQYGFRKKHSTILALINLTDKIRNAIDKGNYAVGIYIDLKKAFDTVDHYILLRKLEHYGIRGKANDLIQNYLSDRYQYTTVNNCSSSFNRIKTGVPKVRYWGLSCFYFI